MSILKLIGFAGETPKGLARVLGDAYAQSAYNTRLNDGGLTPVRKPRFVQQLAASNYSTIYKNGESWMAWTGHVYAAQGPVATDRLYVMGNGVPQMIVAGTTYNLAVPRPSAAPTATASGTATSDLGSARLYVRTFVTAFDEESEPSPVSNEVYWKPGQTVTLSGLSAAPAGRNITKERFYRSQTSTTGTQLYFIAERAVSTADFVDSIAVDAIQEALPSLDWNAPPDDLTGLSAGPNGMMAAFRGKQVYFCEPYRPHAWPEKYVLTTDYPVVGLAWFNGSLAIMTTGVPYIATGTAPENMVSQKTELNLPCINSRGIVDLGYSIAYPSYDGLVVVSESGAQVATSSLFTRDDWVRLNPQSMIAGQYDGRYFASYDYSDVNGQEFTGTFIIDLTGQQPFIIRTDIKAQAMFYDLPNGTLYMLVGNMLYEWDAQSEPFSMQNWKSKLFVLSKPTNFGAILIESDDALSDDQLQAVQDEIDRIIASNATLFLQDSIGGEIDGSEINAYALGGDMLAPIPTVNRTVSVSIYADRKLVATVGKLNNMARLPSGFLARLWEIEVSSDTPISQITMAGTGQELMGV